MTNYILILSVVVVIAVGQLLFKTVSQRLGDAGFLTLVTDPKTGLLFLAALTIYGIATFGWVWALRQVPLSTAYLFMALGFVLVPVLAHFTFGEAVTARLAIGTMMIVGGILVAVSS